MSLHRANDVLRLTSILAVVTGLAFMFAPTTSTVEPVVMNTGVSDVAIDAMARSRADSLTEDIILYNLFAPSRSAPSHRTSAVNGATGQDAGMSDANVTAFSGGFRPELIGTATSEKPGETRALLRLLASDASPRLYAVGDRAGGYSVVSIDARSVVLNGPRGRVVLRLPENDERYS
jgi:hypothetical protein